MVHVARTVRLPSSATEIVNHSRPNLAVVAIEIADTAPAKTMAHGQSGRKLCVIKGQSALGTAGDGASETTCLRKNMAGIE